MSLLILGSTGPIQARLDVGFKAWIYEHFPMERPAPDLKYNPAYPRAMRWRSTASSISAAQAPNRLKHIRHLLDTLIKENKNGQIHQSRRASRISAFYGLTNPPYKLDALEPFMSRRTLEMHWGRHHQDYVEELNKQLENSRLYGHTMEELVKVTYNNGNPLPEFNNAAEVWNHDFFWESMQPQGGNMPWAGLLQQIDKDFGSFHNFREQFVEAALTLFGSGWVWLVLISKEKKLAVIKTSNAVNPLVWGDIPIINLDMWEHAYYLDYKDDRAKYVKVFLNHLVSWHMATVRMIRAEAFVNLGEPKIPIA